jgi:tetratricopeptide (TPR) repeat protein
VGTRAPTAVALPLGPPRQPLAVPQGLARGARSARLAAASAMLAMLALPPTPATAQAPVAAAAPITAPATEPPANSGLDAPLFYQLLIGEMELRGGEPGTAYQVILDAARRTGDGALFRRAVEIALQARAGEQALQAVRAWRTAQPQSTEALRFQLQILNALGRFAETAEPLRALLAASPAAERSGLVASLPRFLQRAEPKVLLALMEEVLAPWRDAPQTRLAVHVALARGAAAAGDMARALELARRGQALEPGAPGPALLGIDWLAQTPAAEALVTTYLAQPGAEPALRLAYVRALTGAQRFAEAALQLETVTRAQPEEPGPWLTLGALQMELRQPAEAEAALKRFLELTGSATAAAPTPGAGGGPARAAESEEDDDNARIGAGRVQAWLMLAQLAEQRGDFRAAEGWLARIDDPQRALEVQVRRASLLARQGRVAEARALVRAAPERRPEDARAKLVAEAGVLRELKRWREAHEVLAAANERFADDADLLYEQAMMSERLDRLDEMERLLKRVMALAPDNAQAYNALGYTWADRGLRLAEARELIVRALALQPGDPFITDSLGWVEYRLGNRDEALRLLQQAWTARPDPEIGVHLGEVLWSLGRQDEARRIWSDVRRRDAANEVLRDTLARLKVEL